MLDSGCELRTELSGRGAGRRVQYSTPTLRGKACGMDRWAVRGLLVVLLGAGLLGATHGHHVVNIDAATPSPAGLLWSVVGDHTFAAPAAGDAVVFVGSEDGLLRAVDR